MFIVLTTYGKNDSVDRVKIDLFDSHNEAIVYSEKTRTGKKKHWVECELVCSGEEIELARPEF